MNTKPVALVQARAQDVASCAGRCTEEDIERAVIEAFAAVFRRQAANQTPEV